MSLVLNVEILGEFKKLTAATTGAQSDLQSMTKRASSASKSISRAFAAIGVGLSFRWIANELEDAGKAAVEDVKSQELLANALRNTIHATDAQIASVEGVINKYQFAASVADDQLRPAYQKLVLSTHDTTKANELLGVALDAAAGTGKSLDQVALAMAKSLAGSDTALLKLIPSLKGSKTPLEDLAKAFDGAAAKAANADPYQRMQVIFQDLQEQIGMALLPTLEKFSAWVASPEGQQKIQEFVTLVTGLVGKFELLAGWALDNVDSLVAWSGAIAAAGIVLKVFTTGVSVYNGVAAIMATRNAAAAASNTVLAASNTAVAETADVAAVSLTAMNASGLVLLSTLGLLAAAGVGAGIGGYQTGQVAGQTAQLYGTKGKDPFAGFGKIGSNGYIPPTKTPASTVNINVNNTNATATDIIKKLDDYYKATGTRLSY